MSEAAKAKRILRGLADLVGITFVAKVKVEPASDPRYGDSNRLDRVVLPTEPEWKRSWTARTCRPRPSRSRERTAADLGCDARLVGDAPQRPGRASLAAPAGCAAPTAQCSPRRRRAKPPVRPGSTAEP